MKKIIFTTIIAMSSLSSAYAGFIDARKVEPAKVEVSATAALGQSASTAEVDPSKPAPVFTLRRSDRTIPTSLNRWAEQAGYSLRWEAKDETVSYEETYKMPFPDAVDAVVKSLRIAGKDLLLCEYNNKVLRVVPRVATCKINQSVNQTAQEGAAQ